MPISKHRRKPGGKAVRRPGAGQPRSVDFYEATTPLEEAVADPRLDYSLKMMLVAIHDLQKLNGGKPVPTKPLELALHAKILAIQMDGGERPDLVALMAPYKPGDTFSDDLNYE